MVNSIKYDNSPLYYKATIREDTVTIGAGATLEVGTILGEISSSGKLKKFIKSNTDGSEVPMAILNRTLVNRDTANAGDMVGSVIILGTINENKIPLDGGTSMDDIVPGKGKVRTILKNNGILVVNSQELMKYNDE